jgi:hypothetical protein
VEDRMVQSMTRRERKQLLELLERCARSLEE